MKKLTIALFAAGLLLMGQTVYAQDSTKQTTVAVVVDSTPTARKGRPAARLIRRAARQDP